MQDKHQAGRAGIAGEKNLYTRKKTGAAAAQPAPGVKAEAGPRVRHVAKPGVTPGAARAYAAAKNEKTKKSARFGRKQRIVALSSGVAVVLTVVLLMVTLMPGAAANPDSSLSGTDVSASVRAAPQGGIRNMEEFVGTVLPETEDAGMEYVEETLFLGDSNTYRMLCYRDVTGVSACNGVGIVSMGITNFTTYRCVEVEKKGIVTMPEAVGHLQPRRVVMTFGTNNAGSVLTKDFIEAYKKALDSIKEEAPYTDIIIASVFPVDQYRQYTHITMDHINDYNEALIELAEAEDVKFLNWSEALLDEEMGFCGFEYTIQDGIHLTREAMEKIFDYFRTHSYQSEDRRPRSVISALSIIAYDPEIILKDPFKISGPIDWSAVSSSSEAASVSLPVSVQFGCWDETNGVSGGGHLTIGGATGVSFTQDTMPGAITSPVYATAAEGYEFAGWSCSAGSMSSGGLAVPADAQPGSTITVTAIFRMLPVASSSVPPPVSSSAPDPVPASSDPVVSGASSAPDSGAQTGTEG